MVDRGNSMCKGAEARKSRVKLEKHYWFVWTETRCAGVVAEGSGRGQA